MENSLNNGAGQAVPHGAFHVPMRYLTGEPTGSKAADMVIMDIIGHTVVYSYRSGKTNRVGMHRRAKLFCDDRRGHYFEERGRKVFVFKNSPYGWVM